ncbi:Fic family protein [Nostoc sp. CHAB 5824]|nr:Fic family protein [Nostoc sp. CHAB 5824]
MGKPEQDIVLVDLGRKPGGRPNRIEEADDGRWIGLGHFIFVYIHPYMDGNGRMARFLMNVMMAAGGYDWTVIPVDRRRVYMEALEAASTRQDIDPFTEFLAAQIRNPVGKIGKVTKT